MAFVYKAIAFPFQKGPRQFPEAAQDSVLIKQALVQLVMTGLGERVMRPKFGTNVAAYLFENVNIDLEQEVRREIASAIALYEPRVRVANISVVTEDTTVDVLIEYLVIATNENQTVTLTLGTI